MNTKNIILLSCIFLLLGFFVGSIAEMPHTTNIKTSTSPEFTSTTTPHALSTPAIQDILMLINEDARTDYSIYVNTLDGKQSFIYNDKQFRSASMIKVFILAKAMEAINEGKLNEDQIIILNEADKVGGAGSLIGYPDGAELTISELLRLMIIQSDNTATNIIIDVLGMDEINEYIKREGYTQSVLNRKMMDPSPIQDNKRNYTSAKDLGIFFAKLYKHQCVNPYLDNKMIDLLVEQMDKDCFPEALPERKIAHKTGELMELYHDGGIIYSPKHNYVLCILTDNIQTRYTTLTTMQKITQLVDSDINE